MYIICARLTAKAGHEREIVEAMQALVPASRAEPGCVAYVAHRAVDDPRGFMFYEQYVDEAAFQAHQATEHYQRWVVGIMAPALEDKVRDIYDEVV